MCIVLHNSWVYKEKVKGVGKWLVESGEVLEKLLFLPGQHGILHISIKYNVITTTCRVYRMLPCPFSIKWVAKHSLPKLRHTNLMLSLWESSQGPLLMTPSPVVLTWQQSHSGTVVVSHHPIHWLCSMAWCCMVGKHSHRNINSSFKQIDVPVFTQTWQHPVWCASNGLQNDPIVYRLLFYIEVLLTVDISLIVLATL